MHRLGPVVIALAILSPPATLAAQDDETAAMAPRVLACDDTAVLWRIEHGEGAYAEAYCKAGCAQYKRDEEPLTTQELAACVKGVEEVTAFYYDSSSAHACLDIDRDIQLIRAWHGRSFDSPGWDAHFAEHYPWNTKRARTPYSGVARRLRIELERMRTACPKLNADQKRYVATLVSALKRGRIEGRTPVLRVHDFSNPEHIDWLEGSARDEIVSRGYDRMTSFAPLVHPASEPLVSKDVWISEEAWALSEASSKGRKPPSVKASIEISVSSGSSKYCNHFHGDEDCGSGGLFFLYFFDEDAHIVAAHSYMAACPFVYTKDPENQWSYQGEVLRGLRRPSMEGTQELRVELSP